MERLVYFVSDRTGITAETLGLSLLTQFSGIEFKKQTFRFLVDLDKARSAAEAIERGGRESGTRPIVFSTLVDAEMRSVVAQVPCMFFDLVDTFIVPMEAEFGQRSSHTIGRSRTFQDAGKYNVRMDAVNYALATDDGQHTQDYNRADVIVVGVSRCGKTPTCLYLALTFGIYAANYPLTEDDLQDIKLPARLAPHRQRIFGLTISSARLQQIRRERKAEGSYASLKQCQYEVGQAEAMYRREDLPFLNTTTISIEEIASTILHQKMLNWRTE